MTPPTEEIRKRTPSDYIFGKVLGEGSFSTVYLAKDVHSGKEYAIKVLEKAHIIREDQSTMRGEKCSDAGSSCPCRPTLWTFQDPRRSVRPEPRQKRDILTQIENRKSLGVHSSGTMRKATFRAKNFKIFFVYAPNRKYYLEDPEGYALEWCKAIDDVKNYYFPEPT
ncbi:hypothetical protein JTB14_023746 [Gonioctena quinquepunctata]|nr:hypothetical protein JTB14_023746 [Gonioctena quinquepunctata]